MRIDVSDRGEPAHNIETRWTIGVDEGRPRAVDRLNIKDDEKMRGVRDVVGWRGREW